MFSQMNKPFCDWKLCWMAPALFIMAMMGCWACSGGAKSTATPESLAPPGLLYKDASQPVEARVRDLLRCMTLDEKIAQTQCLRLGAQQLRDPAIGFSIDSAARYMPNGIGQIARLTDASSAQRAEAFARSCNDIQRYLRERTRLGIPAIIQEKCLQGYTAKDATLFPQPIGMASTWNRVLVENAFGVVAREARADGAQMALLPTLTLVRDPRWRSTQETYGEDPYLAGEMGLAAARGLQGGIPMDTLHVLTRFLPFAAQGSPTGLDYAASGYMLPMVQKQALALGVEVAAPDAKGSPFLKANFEKKSARTAGLDTAVAKILRQKFRLGLFENPYVSPAKASGIAGSSEHQQWALRAAEESIVLLQNKNRIVPIDLERYKKIALFGPNANRPLLDKNAGEHLFTTVFEGLAGRISAQGRGWVVSYLEGCSPSDLCDGPVSANARLSDRQKMEQAISSAKISDLIILALGDDLCSKPAAPGAGTSMQLRGMQDTLFNVLFALGKPMVVLLLNGRPCTIPNIADKADVIFACWHPGQECGTALANLLFGDVSPSGKLPISWPRSTDDLPVHYNQLPTEQGNKITTAQPQFAFGFGLTYSTFELSTPTLSKSVVSAKESVTVRVTVRNIGRRAAQEVVQLYLRSASGTHPAKTLMGFEKVAILPSDSKVVEFTLTPGDWDGILSSGDWELLVGNSSREADLKKVTMRIQ